MLASKAYSSLATSLLAYYDASEANTIALIVLEKITGNRQKSFYSSIHLKDDQIQNLDTYTAALLNKTPVQYVLQEAWFYNLLFFVDNSVLIPRTETEELISWAINTIENNTNITILDIGTGSGCIAIALKKYLPAATVYAIDKSSKALEVATKNAAIHQTKIDFQLIDFLDETTWQQLSLVDIIISNPPYIKHIEANSMAIHVKEFEPALALFVPDNDPLIFYKKIADFAKTHLKQNGNIFVEINQQLGKETIGIFEDSGFSCVLRKDINSNERMIKASNE